MRNTLFWIGLAILSLQDLFKKQPDQTKRQQQFLQTGETAQAFIEGTGYTYSSVKKKLIKIFGKPNIVFKRSDSVWYIELPKGKVSILLTNQKKFIVQLFYSPYDVEEFLAKYEREIPYWKRTIDVFRLNNFDIYRYIFISVLYYCVEGSDNEDYQKIYDIANSGDWELALEIAKGQGLLNSQKIDGVSNGIVTCSGCGWDWELSDGGNDPYVCHKCGHDNELSI